MLREFAASVAAGAVDAMTGEIARGRDPDAPDDLPGWMLVETDGPDGKERRLDLGAALLPENETERR